MCKFTIIPAKDQDEPNKNFITHEAFWGKEFLGSTSIAVNSSFEQMMDAMLEFIAKIKKQNVFLSV